MAQAAETEPRHILAPLPETVRGFGIHIDGHAGKKLMAYTNGSYVFIRSIENPNICSVFMDHRPAKATVAKISPNGEWVASGDDRGRVLVWGIKNKIIKNDLIVCRKVLDISWSGDSERLIAAGDGADVKARVFNRDSTNQQGDIAGHGKGILSCAFKPSRPFFVATAGEDNLLCFHKGPPFAYVKSFKEHKSYCNAVRYSSDGKYFITVGSDQKIYLFDGTSGDLVKPLESKDNSHKGSIYSVSWSPDNTKVLTASGDKTAKIWNIASGEVETTFTFPDAVEHQQVSALWCGDYLLTVSLNGCINYLDVANPAKPKQVLQGHQGGISAVVADSKTGVFYSADTVGAVAKWDQAVGSAQWFAGKPIGKGVTALALSADTNSLVATSIDDKLRVCSAANAVLGDAPVATGGFPSSLASSKRNPDLAVLGVSQGKLVVLRKGAAVHTAVIKYKPTCIDFAPDDSEIAVSGDDKCVHVYALNGDSLSEKKVLSDFTTTATVVAYSANGQYLAAAEAGGRSIYVYDHSSWTIKNPLGWQYHNAAIAGLAWSPSGHRLASVSLDQSLIVWGDTKEFGVEPRFTVPLAHSEGASHVRFIGDDLLVTSGSDKTIKIWELPAK